MEATINFDNLDPKSFDYLQKRVLHAVTVSKLPFVAVAVARFIGFPMDEVRHAMSEMWRKGIVEQREDGTFAVEEGAEI